MITATPFSAPVTYHGEGAVWSANWGGLRCVDMLRGDILHFDSAGVPSRHNVGTIAALIRPAGNALSLVAREHDIVLWDESTGHIEVLIDKLVAAESRLNEGSCTPQGGLLIGSVTPGANGPVTGGAQLIHVRSDRVEIILPTVSVSNGIGFNADGTRAYYADSPTHRIDVFTVTETGDLIERRPFAEFEVGRGAPDGLWVDEDGGVWAAVYGGSRVQRFLPTGKPDLRVDVDARQVTSCTFGGPDLSTLFITTSRENLAEDDDPLAGSIFHAEVGVRGLPVLPFKLTTTVRSVP